VKVYLMFHSAVVFTDSGGIQEETTALKVPCVTLRNNTERPITIQEGTNRLGGTIYESILNAWRDLTASPNAGKIPQFWDGKAAERSVQAIGAVLS
jgi:UDP-N-acetylglucosamine 2-epimerase (non-hydrolysing)